MTMGYHIQIGDPNPDLDHIETLVRATFTEVDQTYNNWNPDSEISQLNHLQPRQIVALSPQLATFLKKIDHIIHLTQGRFDPTIAPIKTALLAGTLATPTIGWEHIHLENTLFWKDQNVTLDLGGVAKGYAVDLLTERLTQAGYQNLYVEWGGEIRTTGHHPKKRPWKIAILGGKTLTLTTTALATSGSYLQKWTLDGTTYTHIIDPSTKKPLLEEGPITSVTVQCTSCYEADALATAIMLFPSKEEAYAWAEEHGIKIWLY